AGTTSRAAVAGVATFGGLSIAKAGTGYVLTATDSTDTLAGGATVDTTAFDVPVGTADHLVITSGASSVASGVAKTLTAEIRDAAGNVVDSNAAVDFAQTAGPGDITGLG